MNDQEDKDKANEGRTQEGQRRNAVELSKPIGLPRNFKIPIVEDLDLEDPSDKKDMKQGSKSARRNQAPSEGASNSRNLVRVWQDPGRPTRASLLKNIRKQQEEEEEKEKERKASESINNRRNQVRVWQDPGRPTRASLLKNLKRQQEEEEEKERERKVSEGRKQKKITFREFNVLRPTASSKRKDVKTIEEEPV